MADVNLTVSDPVTATIREICQAITAICTFLSTPEGQLTAKAVREGTVAIDAGIHDAIEAIKGVFDGK